MARLSWVLGTIACSAIVLHVHLAGVTAEEKPAQPRTDLYGDPLPEGAIARLGTVRYRPAPFFGAQPFALLPDDKTVLVTQEQVVELWDLSTGLRSKRFELKPLIVRGVAVSPDGKLMAVAGFSRRDLTAPNEGEVRLIELETGNMVRRFERSSSDSDRMVLKFSPDGKLLLSAGRTGMFRVEEVATGTELLAHQFPSDVNPEFVLSPDGETIAYSSGANTQKVFCWNWKHGDEPIEWSLPGERRPVQLAFSPDGKWLVISNDVVLPPEIWDIESRQMLRRLLFPEGTFASGRSVSYSADGKWVVLSGTKPPMKEVTHVWDAASGKHLRTMDAGPMHVLTSDSKRLVSPSPMGVWDLETGKRIAPEEDRGHSADLNSVAFLPNGNVVSASRDETLRVWQADTMKQKHKLPVDHWPSVATSPDGRWLLSAGHDNAVRLWEADSGREVFKLPGHGRVGSRYLVAFAPDSRTFLTFGDDLHIRTWDVATGKVLTDSKIQPSGINLSEDRDDHDSLFSKFCFSPDGKTLLFSFHKTLHCIDASTGKELRLFKATHSSIDGLSYSPDGKRVLVSGLAKPKEIPLPDGGTRTVTGSVRSLLILDAETGEELVSLETPEGSWGITQFMPDGKQFADASFRAPHTVRFHDTESGKLLRSFDLPSRPSTLTFSPDGQTLATGHQGGDILLWDLQAVAGLDASDRRN